MQLNNIDFKEFIVNVLLADKYLEIWALDVDDGIYYKFQDTRFVESGFTFADTVEIVHPDERKDYMESVNHILIGFSQSLHRRYRIRQIDGSYNLFIVSFMLFGKAPGKRYLLVSTRNVTSFASSDTVDLYDDKNDESRRLLVEILDSLPAVAFIKDIDNEFRFIVANDMFTRFFAPGHKSVVGLRLEDFASPRTVEIGRSSDLKALKHNSMNPFRVIEKFPNPGGGYSYLQCYKFYSSFYGRNLLICAALDVSELFEAKSRAEESDRLKSSFLTNISHEIRTPLNAIVGFSDLLINTADSREKDQYLQIIKKNNERLLMLVNDVLDLSKLESGTVRFNKDKFEMGSLCDDVYVLFNPKFQEKRVAFTVEKPEKLVFLNQDAVRVREVIVNLVSNAQKYTSSGSVRLGYREQEVGVYVYVDDTGVGISAENRKKVFDRFEKLDSLVPGTGLGLCICKTITEAMHGRIGVESQPGKGSTFWFWIPKE